MGRRMTVDELEIECPAELPEELVKVYAGYEVLRRALGEEAAQAYLAEILGLANRLLLAQGIVEQPIPEDTEYLH